MKQKILVDLIVENIKRQIGSKRKLYPFSTYLHNSPTVEKLHVSSDIVLFFTVYKSLV